MKISLGPIQYYWSRSDIVRFYDAIADSRVDIVYLGEVVCSKRHAIRLADWLDLARALRSQGKEVVLSMLAMPETEADLRRMQSLADADGYLLEANDMSAVGLLAPRCKPFVAGPHINCYSAPVLDWLTDLGASRWVAPIECTRDTIAAIDHHRASPAEIEYFVFGHAPLSFSARCFTARHHNLQKDQCGHRCADNPSGINASTLEGQPFIRLNGTQTQTAQVVNLAREIDRFADAGISILRIAPQALHTTEIANTFADLVQGTVEMDDGYRQLCELQDAAPCDGFWFGKPGVSATGHTGG
ncbi:MAG: U32 family peptidase [Paraburkholderia sp.]|jgi:collagenase-like PrtC family protease|nr:U32 family peptidase [Paraburkholderia sp.]